MAIDYANLFTTMGKIGKFVLAINTQQDAWDDKLEEIADAQDDQIARDAISDLLTAASLKSGREGVAAIYDKLRAAGEAVLIAYVKADQPSKATTVEAALEELRRQMAADSESVKQATVSVTATALTNQGTGAIVTATKRGDGKEQELQVPETGFFTCTADSQTGGTGEGQEVFTFAGEADDGDESREDWPTGSGASTTVTVIDPTQDNDGGNVLTNSDMESWSGTPLALDKWSITTGTYGTDLVREGTTVYKGTYAAKLVGGATLTAWRQQFNSSANGTAYALLPLRSYAINFFAKVDVVPAAGVLTVELIDGSAAVINDDAGTANSTTYAITGWTTSFVSKTVVFRTPKLIPDTVYLRFRLSTAISAGTNAFIDHLAMGLTTELYAGGPSVAVFPGATKWVAGDGWKLTPANNYGGSTFRATFQALFDRFFDLRSKRQLLPTNSLPTRADTLITA